MIFLIVYWKHYKGVFNLDLYIFPQIKMGWGNSRLLSFGVTNFFQPRSGGSTVSNSRLLLQCIVLPSLDPSLKSNSMIYDYSILFYFFLTSHRSCFVSLGLSKFCLVSLNSRSVLNIFFRVNNNLDVNFSVSVLNNLALTWF